MLSRQVIKYKYQKKLETNKKFFAWLYANRFGSQVEEWQEFVASHEEKEIKQLTNEQKEEVEVEIVNDVVSEEEVEVEIIDDVVEVTEENKGDL